MTLRRRRWLAAGLCALLAGCGGGALAPVEGSGTESPKARAPVSRTESPEAGAAAPVTHVVAAGETLYAIAWRYGLDYQRIAEWNHIPPPYVIHAGERLRLRGNETAAAQPAPRPAAAAPPAQRPATETPAQSPKTLAANAPPPAAPVKSAAEKEKERARSEARDAGNIRWQWPARGRVVTSDGALGQNGINILGTPRQPVYAAAAGEVVYSGS